MPLVLLAGRDRHRSANLPDEGREQHVLRGYKARDLMISGKPLLLDLLARLRACEAFDPILVAGPAEVYANLADGVQLVDTDADFGDNIRAGLEAAMATGGPGPVAVMTSDILPDPEDLAEAVDDMRRTWPWDFWAAYVRARDRERLGTSAWKPKYLIQPDGESEAVAVVPGHLFAADPRTIRLDLLYTLLELSYRTRNQPIGPRRRTIVRSILLTLLRQDLKRLFTGRRPGITRDMLWPCLILVRKLTTTGCPQHEMEDRLRRVWVKWEHRKRHRERRGRCMITHGLSLGRDIDTEEEAREIIGA